MERPKTNALIVGTLFATLIVFLGPFVGAITPQDMATMTTAIGIMGVSYFGLVSPKREEVSPLVTLLFLSFAALSSAAMGIFAYDGVVQAILLSFIFVLLSTLEIGTWYYTAVYEVEDVPPIMKQTIPQTVLPDEHDKLNDPVDSSEDLNQSR